MCNVNVVNRISCICLIIFFLEGTGVALATLATPLATPLVAWYPRPLFSGYVPAGRVLAPNDIEDTRAVDTHHGNYGHYVAAVDGVLDAAG